VARVPQPCRQASWLIPVLLWAGAVSAGDEDILFSRLANSPVLIPHFQFSDAGIGLDATPRDSTRLSGLLVEQGRDAKRLLDSRVLAIEWQHSVDPAQQWSLSAQYGDQVRIDSAISAATRNSAAVGWSRQFDNASQMTGRLFLGDEDDRLRLNGYSARRYYGLQFEGRYALWHDHAPFAGLSWEHNDYDAVDAAATAGSSLHSEGISRFTAGWSWQVSPLFDVRAEARYRLTDEVSDPAEQDRTQLYLRTRYGFR
jgi:hypothetical protein